jgi:hypothetical protein
LQKLSSATRDLYRNGFLAKTQAEEIPAPDLELNQLMSISDVTAQVFASAKPGMSDADLAAAKSAKISEIEKDAFVSSGLKSTVVELYKGGQYHLYQYKKYTDVRLVFSPELAIAFFGGDPDNFEYPRFDLDMTLFRVYENGVPLKTEHFLKWSTNGAAANELVFVSGNPGRTNRMLTVDALAFWRDSQIPYTLNRLRRMEISLQQLATRGEEEERIAKDDLFSIENSRKVYLGELASLQNNSFFQEKQRQEYALRAKVENDAKLKPLSTAWLEVSAAQKEAKVLFKRYALLESGHAFNSKIFQFARTLVRLAEESQKPNDKRLPEYWVSSLTSLRQKLFSTAPLYSKLEVAKLKDSLSFLAETYGYDHPFVSKVLGGVSPEMRARILVEGSSLSNPDVRKLLEAGGAKAINSSNDPMIVFAKLVDKESRKIRAMYEEKVLSASSRAYAKVAQALFAVYGTSIYPDATFTLRLAFGEVKGYQEAGKGLPAWTTIGGAFDREIARKSKYPFILPASWHQAKSKLNLATPFNFVSTADIIGGNSGSPVVNRAGELVGLIFDGNLQSLSSDFLYTDQESRSISVHSSAILEALNKVYGAGAIASELGK